MLTYNGILKFTKTEEKEMRIVLEHCKRDISYGGGGSFTKGDNNDDDTKEMEKAKRGIKNLEWILETYKK